MNPKLSTEEKSLIALDKLLSSISEDDMNAVANKIKAIEFEGPSIEEYFANFESHYTDLFNVESGDQQTKLQNIETVKFAGIQYQKFVKISEPVFWKDWGEIKPQKIKEKTLEETFGGFLLPLCHE